MDTTEVLYGKEIAQKMRALNEGLMQIEKDNEDIFLNRVSHLTNEKPDKLANHYVYMYSPDEGFKFTFKRESDIPYGVKLKCIDLCKTIWGKGEVKI